MLEPVHSRLESYAATSGLPLLSFSRLLVVFFLILSGCDTFSASETDVPEPSPPVTTTSIPALQPFASEEHCSESLPQNAEGTAIFIVCVPEFWNGDLVIYAHGLVSPSIDYPVITPETTELATLVGTMGYAFAATSYSTNGLAFAEGLHDVVDLVEHAIPASGLLPTPNRVYLTGASEGGLITTLAAERHPDVFDGALATCGPAGSLTEQINFTGDFRVLFDYYYPGLISGSPFNIPQEVTASWEQGMLKDSVRLAITEYPGGARQLLTVLGLPVDLNDVIILQDAVMDGLNNSITTANDAVSKLGGLPFGNTSRTYQGSNDDDALNQEIARYSADAMALARLSLLESTGNLKIPYVNVHTTGDTMVPLAQQDIYRSKIQNAGKQGLYSELAPNRFGHCTFETTELIVSFAHMVEQVTGVIPAGATQLTSGNPTSQELFDQLAKHGNAF